MKKSVEKQSATVVSPPAVLGGEQHHALCRMDGFLSVHYIFKKVHYNLILNFFCSNIRLISVLGRYRPRCNPKELESLNFLSLQRMTIYYRDRLGMYPYLSREGEQVNGGLPQLGNLSAHLALATKQVLGMLRPNFTGLGVIDWEEWHPLWGRNSGVKRSYRLLSKQLVKEQRPDLSRRDTRAAARKEFEESAQRYMVETLESTVRQRPRGLWGFYGFPVCFNRQLKTGRCTFISPASPVGKLLSDTASSALYRHCLVHTVLICVLFLMLFSFSA